MRLPSPRKSRWQPLRGGLLNLYFFDHEIFEYEDGRLLLRGNNGSGKSRVLALQLPFLFDGEVRPERLEPDGDSAKRIEWHLLMNGRYPDRIGYTWLELGRMSEEGPLFRTIGCGMHAVQGKGAPTKWFFLTKQRIGQGLDLVGPGGAPLTRARLEHAIGSEGEVFESAERYRNAVDREFFALGGYRYRALMDVLVALRKPQLSRQLDEEQLSAALTEALPPVSPEILTDVAEAFRGLETDRAELEASRSAASAARVFLEGYRRYVAVAARRRARDVRTAQSSFEGTNRELRGAEGELETASAEARTAGERRTAARAARAAADEVVRTLESSPEMQNARDLANAKSAARTAEAAATRAREDRDRAAADADGHRARSEQLLRDCDEHREAAATLVETLRAHAVEASLARVVRETERLPIDTDAPDEVATSRQCVERELVQRREHLKILKTLASLAERRREEQRLAGDAVEKARMVRDAARDACATSRSRREDACDALLQAYDEWRLALQVLELPASDMLASDLRIWVETRASSDTPIRRAIDDASRSKVEQLAGIREQLLARRAEHEESLALLERERADLLAGRHREPPRRPALGEAPRDREGAPLWAVCDFREPVPAEQRAEYEAAMEASGLLDAWVGPDGLVVAQADGELYLTAAGAPLARSLAQILRPAIDEANPRSRTLTEARIESVLRRIGAEETPGETWVSADGRFSVGVLHGRWTKPSAEYIGHGARETARRARLHALELEIERQRALVASADSALAEHDARRRCVDEERSRAPSDDRLRDAVEQVTRDDLALANAERALAAAEAALDAARHAFEKAHAELWDGANAVGLADRIADLEMVEEATRTVELAAARLWSAIVLLGAIRSQAAAAADVLSRAEESLARAQAALEQADAEAAAASARAATLEAAIGQTARAIMTRLSEAKDVAERTKKDDEKAETALLDAREAVARLEGVVAGLRRTAADRAAARDGAVGALLALARTHVLSVLGEASVPDADRASTTAIVELARRLEATLSSVPSEDPDWERAQRDLNTRFMDLDTALGPHGYRPALLEEASVRVVRVPFRGKEIDVYELSGTLEDDVASRERILEAREREIIESHLLGEISTHLHHQLRRAEELVALMNQEIETRPMSTGMKLKFTWQPHHEGPPGFEVVRQRLLATQATWSVEERRNIGDFLHRRIGEVRAKQDAGTWREHLAEAFDYRRWHRFGVSRYQDGRWQMLNRRTHGTGSGGEKAIALTLPQLAAAAAHYRSASPHAPRLILLDEAFVGVDNDMRGKCFDLLGSFDLDFVMTSEREWGCYPAVPSLAIYQLTTRPGIDAVHTTRLVWNGKQLRRDEEHLRS